MGAVVVLLVFLIWPFFCAVMAWADTPNMRRRRS